jgi:hypothetical protein
MILATRPRVWLTPSLLTILKARAAVGTKRWTALQAAAARAPDWDIGVLDYALCYAVTGDTGYRDKALALINMWIAGGTGAVSPDSGYQCRSYFPPISAAYDWLYPDLSPADRQRMADHMTLCFNWVWPETNPARANDWAIDNPGNNYYHGFLSSWMVPLALGADSLNTPSMMALSQSKWDQAVLPYLGSTASGGYMIEGTSYGVDSWRLMSFYRLALATATQAGTGAFVPSLIEARRMLAALTTPDWGRLYPAGDQTKSSEGWVGDPCRSIFLVQAGALYDPQSQFWCDQAGAKGMQQRANLWEEFLWYPEEQAPNDYRQTWPTWRSAEGAGLHTMRSNWAESATMVTFQAGPVLESHQDRAAGMFGLFAGGDWLVGWSKLNSHSGIAQETNDSACVEIGGRRQTWTQDHVRVAAVEETEGYSLRAADLAAAYADQCGSYLRELFFWKPNLVLVHDRIGTPSGQVLASFPSAGLEPTLAPDGWTTTGEGGKLFALSVVPITPALTKIGLTLDHPNGPAWRVDNPDNGSGEFLMAFEVAPLNQIEGRWQAWHNVQLAGVVSSQALIVWSRSASPWSYTSPGAFAHVILGAEPGRLYRVPGGTAPASAGGVLMFTGAIAGTPMTIAPADGGGGGGGGGGLTNRTFTIVEGTLQTPNGPITLTGGQLVVQAIPGDMEPVTAKPAKGKKR